MGDKCLPIPVEEEVVEEAVVEENCVGCHGGSVKEPTDCD